MANVEKGRIAISTPFRKLLELAILGTGALVIVNGPVVGIVARMGMSGSSSSVNAADAGSLLCSDRPPADMDGDCNSTLGDFAQFTPCLTGPATGPSTGCPIEVFEVSDVDGSGHTDLLDVARFQTGFGQTGGFTIPDDWGGTWQVTLTARDCTTKQILAIDEYEDLVCPGEVFAEGLIKLFEDCPAVLSGDSLAADCERAFTVEACDVRLMLQLAVQRSGDTLSGQVQWWGELAGICDLLGQAPCEVMTIEGERVSTDTVSCRPKEGGQP